MFIIQMSSTVIYVTRSFNGYNFERQTYYKTCLMSFEYNHTHNNSATYYTKLNINIKCLMSCFPFPVCTQLPTPPYSLLQKLSQLHPWRPVYLTY